MTAQPIVPRGTPQAAVLTDCSSSDGGGLVAAGSKNSFKPRRFAAQFQALATMDSSHLLTKAFLALGLACAVAVVVLFNIAGAGLLARLLVYAFLAGLIASGIATALSSGAPKALRRTCGIAFSTYALVAAAVVLWVVIAKPPFG